MKVVVICDESLSAKTALANSAMAKIAVSFITLEEKKVFLVGDEGVSEIIRDTLLDLLKAPTIMIFSEEKKEEKKILDEYLKFVSFVRQHKIVHIRSPCKTGMSFYVPDLSADRQRWDSFRLKLFRRKVLSQAGARGSVC